MKTPTVFAILLLETGAVFGTPPRPSKALVWEETAPADHTAGYRVYERVGGKWKKIGTATEARFRLKNLKPGRHVYAVTSVGEILESKRSGSVIIKIPK